MTNLTLKELLSRAVNLISIAQGADELHPFLCQMESDPLVLSRLLSRFATTASVYPTPAGPPLPHRHGTSDCVVLQGLKLRLVPDLVMVMMMIALNGSNRDFTISSLAPLTASNTCARVVTAQSCANHLRHIAYHAQHVVCHVVRRDSSAIKFDRFNSHLF